MRFGKSYEDAKKEPSGGGGGNFMRSPRKDKPATIRILDEPEAWESWWEHFDNGLMKSYPCTGDRDQCPGCLSPNERTKKAGRKVGFNAVRTYDGKQYVNVWKVTKKTAEKLETRAKKDGTIRARDYTILGTEGDNGFVEYDVDSEDKEILDLSEYDQKRQDVNEMLMEAFDDAFGEGAAAALDDGQHPNVDSGVPRESGNSQSGTSQTKTTGAPASKPPTESSGESEVERLRRELAEAQAKNAPAADKHGASKLPEDPPSEPEEQQDARSEGAGDPPWEPEEKPEPEQSGEPEPEYTLNQLEAMKKGELLAVIKAEQKAGRLPDVDVSKKTQKQMLDWLVENAS